MNGKNTVIHWFRKGLRVHDNPALLKSFDIVRNDPNYVLRPIFILDPGIVDWMNVGANRWRFLQQSLEQLNENLLKLGTRLYVVRGSPKDVFPRIFTDWNVNFLTFERDIEPYALKRDELVAIQAKEYNVKIIEELSHNVFNPELILQKNDGKPIMQYQKFISIAEKCKEPVPVDVPLPLPSLIVPKDSFETLDEKCYDHPTLDQLVKKPSELGPNKYPGGENEGLSRMEQYLKRKQWVADFEKPNTAPNSIEPSTTVLSPYLKFGCLSSRVFYKKLKAVLLMCKKYSKPPVSLMGQLMWREFYYCAGASESNFDKMEGNNICYQIPWQRNDDHLRAWTNGTTGYPFIDAIMRQLRQEGWIHHLARHAVACFLTRGDLWISWEEGQKVFEELLLDADWALNAGNWMWLSASAFFYQYFRVYSPVAFGKKTDPDGKYIRKYVPELKLYPSAIIYEPWKASENSQKAYRCVIGKDYPKRIVIHETIHKENLSKMAQAYKKNKEEREKLSKRTSTLSNKSNPVVSQNKRKRSSPTAGNPSKVKRQ